MAGSAQADEADQHEANALEHVYQEIAVMSRLESTRLPVRRRDRRNSDVRREALIREFFEEPAGRGAADGARTIYIVMRLMKGGDIHDAIQYRGSLCEEDCRAVMRAVLATCAELHAQRTVHRDIKPENVFLSDPGVFHEGVVLGDFGLTVAEENVTVGAGSPYYAAPEVLLAGGSDRPSLGGGISEERVRGGGPPKYGCAADIWSCGALLYSMLAGFSPFDDCTNFYDMSMRALAGDYRFDDPVWSLASEGAIDLVCRLMRVNPAERLTVTEALRHPWLQTEF